MSQAYQCRRIHAELTIDGHLDKAAWQSAPAVTLVETVSGDAPRWSTRAKLLWSEKWLYAGFHCEDDDDVNATLTAFNDRLWEEEVVELFIDDDGDLKSYLEFEINPLNAVLHYCVHLGPGERLVPFARVENVVLSAVRRGPGFFEVEFAIPFTEFVTARNSPPLPGDVWRVNFYRIDRPRNGTAEYTAWQPTGKIQFHMPERFGSVEFVS